MTNGLSKPSSHCARAHTGSKKQKLRFRLTVRNVIRTPFSAGCVWDTCPKLPPARPLESDTCHQLWDNRVPNPAGIAARATILLPLTPERNPPKVGSGGGQRS